MGLLNKLFYTLLGGKHIMSTLLDIQNQVIALQEAQIAEAARQDTKVGALNTALIAIQSELDVLKAAELSPENQAIVDKAVIDIAGVIAALNAEAV
jgi:hypothetical protein